MGPQGTTALVEHCSMVVIKEGVRLSIQVHGTAFFYPCSLRWYWLARSTQRRIYVGSRELAKEEASFIDRSYRKQRLDQGVPCASKTGTNMFPLLRLSTGLRRRGSVQLIVC